MDGIDSIRFFTERAKAALNAYVRAGRERPVEAPSPPTLRQVQQQVASDAGFRSWSELLSASAPERRLAAVMTREPMLTYEGMETEPQADEREALRAQAALVAEVCAWLAVHIEPCPTFNPRAGSYSVKHIAEKALGSYVPNGALIAAALILGYDYKWDRSSRNVAFRMRERSLKAARQMGS